jgi:hypothetical protein
VEKDAAYYRKDARNAVWAVAFGNFIPTLGLLALVAAGEGHGIKWDAVTYGLMAYSLTLTFLAIIAGILCGKGKKVGRILAFFPTGLLLLFFPIGTIIGVFALSKLLPEGFVESLT